MSNEEETDFCTVKPHHIKGGDGGELPVLKRVWK